MNNQSLERIKKYIESKKIVSAIEKGDSDQFRQHRVFYRFLHWEFIIQKLPEGTTKQYAIETLSDISAAILQGYINLYKPALQSGRSAIENSLRVFLSTQAIDITAIVSVYDLFTEARKHNLYDGLSVEIINNLSSYYADLCQAVHSSNHSYLTQQIPFDDITTPDPEKFKMVSEKSELVIYQVNRLFFLSLLASVKSLDPAIRDVILDSLPKSDKRQVEF